MLEQSIIALVKTGIPVFALSVAVLYWINYRSQASQEKRANRDKDIAQSPSDDDAADSQETDKTDFLHKKWVQFGGGFYGMLGLLTYLVVEWNELIELLGNVGQFELTVGNIISELVIKFLVESLINLITALTWPIYWLGKLGSTSAWMGLLAAYLGYWAGEKLVKYKLSQKRSN